ncbi:deoxyuridine 5'-triphosphate nucleotidohydrolase [Desulfotomaculum arcticum]|uniref:Deoxyuridine 5'-triphosphate nucleotidohydrolase n=1 Tax=Desulfotruncus arcticus DSM 17038 TaxID=1121424 RepID=A0A1I2S8G5_9FIRM|nr:dUTP diphosphatase [Desulfotruncus arcticus]SFG49185.1 deoxyuridine 5'-triphosphate nucleotidohydrolase [Desulfotomaculum arcticum] [Desulfotruncus arcticus DSM 17038]
MIIKFKKINPTIGDTIPSPSYVTTGAAGIDLAAAIVEPVTVEPGERVMIPTGLAVDIPTTEIVGLVFPRSGLAARHGLALANAVGVIDSDYKGEILCPVQNNGEQPYQIKPGDRIAQLLFMPVLKAQIEFTEELSESERGKGGFGSTGR